MPLPHSPGYHPPRQSQVDRRRVLLVLRRRAAAHASNSLAQPSLERGLVVVLVASPGVKR